MTTTDIEKFEIKLAEEAGLAFSGRDAGGNLQFIGTKQQWEEFERLTETSEADNRGEGGVATFMPYTLQPGEIY